MMRSAVWWFYAVELLAIIAFHIAFFGGVLWIVLWGALEVARWAGRAWGAW